ncbi:MAG: hypothetical protein ACRDI0_02470 [Actinomycetota bacterium]
MKRLLWVGVGVAVTVMAVRWLQKQRRRYGPEAVGARLSQGSRDLAELVRVSLAEGRRAMAEKEAEIRASLGE